MVAGLEPESFLPRSLTDAERTLASPTLCRPRGTEEHNELQMDGRSRGLLDAEVATANAAAAAEVLLL